MEALLTPDTVVKLFATALVVVFATAVAERTTAFIGAMIAALPVSAGPAYLFIAMEHGAEFVSKSALTGAGVNVMTGPFLFCVAGLMPRFGPVVSLAVGGVVWSTGAYLILHAGLGAFTVFALSAAVYPALHLMSRRWQTYEMPPRGALRYSDIFLRIVAVACVVLAVLQTGRILGPNAAGLVALIPVVWLSVTLITYARMGRQACSAVLSNGIFGMFGYCFALTALHYLAPQSGLVIGLSAALLIAVGWNAGLSIFRLRPLKAA